MVLYRRIFETTAFRKRTLIVGAASVVWLVVVVFINIFQCRPLTAAFDPEAVFTDRCINLQAYYLGLTALNLGLDLVILFLPLQMIWQLKLPMKQKLALSGIFSIGIL